jgi:NTP pyrophosphatase (non-canonical NTP hydrolase)
MFTENDKLRILRITDYYGHKIEKIVAQEELAELIQAISKNLQYDGNIESIKEEIADVYICLEELKLMLNISEEELNDIKEFKLNRMMYRIRNEEPGKARKE